jgi:D-glycero-D-manno-heptose 1,7-bisphosphate phosphatase
MSRAVFLDRDGVLNRAIIVAGLPRPPVGEAEIEILEGAAEAIQKLKGNGYIPVVVTNQPDVARGMVSSDEVHAINRYIGLELDIDHFYVCFHDDKDLCACRKPAPGLIIRASLENHLDISKSVLVGDRWRDIAAAQAAGCPSYFIDYSYSEKFPQMPFTRVSSLLEAAEIIIRKG